MASLISSTTLAPDNGAIAATSPWAILNPGETVEYDITHVAGATQNLHFQYSDSPTTHWVDIVKLSAVEDGTQDVTNGRWTNPFKNRVFLRFINEETSGSSTDEQITVSADTVADALPGFAERDTAGALLRDVQDEFRRYYQKLYIGYDGSSNDALRSTTAESMVRFVFDLNAAGSYGFYTRSYISTASVDADAARIYATVNDVTATTVRGLHCSLSFGDTGTVTGMGAAAEFTVHVHNEGDMTGHIYGVKSAIHSDAADSDTAGAVFAFYAAVNQGAGTGATGTNAVDDDAYLFHLDGFAIADDHMIDAAATAYDGSDFTHGIKIRIGSTDYWLLASTVNPKNT